VAADLVRRAGAAGAELLLLPETYPGPLRADDDYDAEPALAGAAREAGCAVCWSRIERDDGRAHVVAYVTAASGERAARYVRSHPATGDVHVVLSGTPVAPGERLEDARAEVGSVRVAVTICSELWLPEVARTHAVAGAELLLSPAGGGFGPVADNWQAIARARALENQCYVLLTAHRFDGEPGIGMIAGPEVVLEASPDQELLVATCDLGRLRWLRSRDDGMERPKPFSALPGLLRARRPELYAGLTADQGDRYDYEASGRPR
jgi:predicted amidohydrolase